MQFTVKGHYADHDAIHKTVHKRVRDKVRHKAMRFTLRFAMWRPRGGRSGSPGEKNRTVLGNDLQRMEPKSYSVDGCVQSEILEY